jgi:hypothetical protein
MVTQLDIARIEFVPAGLRQTLKSLDSLSEKSRKAEKEARQLTHQYATLNKGLSVQSGGKNNALDQLRAGLETLKTGFDEVAALGGRVAAGVGDAFGSAFEKMVIGGRDVKGILAGLEADLLRLGTRALTKEISHSVTGENGLLSSLGATLFSGGQSMFSDLFPGFATGGSFTVGGRAGVDRNLVGLRLTRGEKVTVQTPAQQQESSNALRPENTPSIHMAFNITTPDANSFRRSQSQIQGDALRQAQRTLQRNG